MTGSFTGNLLEGVRWFLVTTPALGLLFLALIFLMALLQVRLPEARVRALFQRRRASTSYLAGAALGTVTPFCSMTTIPVLAVLLRSGVPFGPTMAFLISSPLLDGIVLGVLVFLIGPKLTVLYAAVTFLASMGIGALFARFGFERDVKDRIRAPVAHVPRTPHAGMFEGNGESGPAPGTIPTGVPALEAGRGAAAALGRRGAWRAVRQAWGASWSAFVSLLPHLLLGTTIGALVRGFMPVGWIVAVAGPDQPFAIPLMALLGLPVYINAEILLPITAALLDKGMGIGAVVALVITGLGMSASEVALLTGFFRLPVIAALAAGFLAVAVAGGALATLVAG
ncbi:MAG: permease [Chloroflexi bacterium]|nr:permease [Chloroflexota bacterium]